MKIPMILFLSILLTCLNCEKEPPPIVVEPPTTDTVMQLFWHVPCSDGIYQPVLYKNEIGWCEGFGGNDKYYVFRDTSNGTIIWNWINDVPDLQELRLSKDKFQQGDKLCWAAWDKAMVVDLAKRSTSWWTSTKPHSGSPRSKLSNDHFYHAHETGTWATSLVRTKLDIPNWDTLYTLESAQWETTLQLPTEYITVQGDTLAIFIEAQLEKVTNRGRVNMVSLNTKTKQTVWRIEDYEPDGLSNTQFLEIHNGRIYKLGESRVWCIDAETGQIIWYRDFDPNNYGDEHFMGNNYALIHGGRIYAKGGYKHMEALDLETGQVIWATDAALSAHYCLYEYKGRYIIYAREGGGGIAVHRMSDGSLVYKNNKIAWGASSGTDLAVDNANDRIYWADGKFAYCFRLNLP